MYLEVIFWWEMYLHGYFQLTKENEKYCKGFELRGGRSFLFNQSVCNKSEIFLEISLPLPYLDSHN